MAYGYRPRYNYDKQTKENEKPLIEKLDPIKIDEFKIFLSDLDERIRIKFGPPVRTERLRLDKINSFVVDMPGCKALAMVIYYDHATKNLLNFKKISSIEKSGEDALIYLKYNFGETLKLPWMRRMNLFDYPFEAEYKKNGNSKCVNLTTEFRKVNTVAKYRLLIRSID